MAATGARIRVPVAVACRVGWVGRPRGTTSGSSTRCPSGTGTTRTSSTRAVTSMTMTPPWATGSSPMSSPTSASSPRRTGCGGCARPRGSSPPTTARGKPASPGRRSTTTCSPTSTSTAGSHDFTAPSGPNQVWLTDITEHPTREGKLYLCAVKDCYSNKIVGYSIDSRMKSSPLLALRNAIALRSPQGTIVHTDRGSQFRSKKVVRLLKNNGLRGSMGRVGAGGQRGHGVASSRCCRRTSWTPAAGTAARNCASRSSPGSKPSTTAAVASGPWASSPRSSLR